MIVRLVVLLSEDAVVDVSSDDESLSESESENKKDFLFIVVCGTELGVACDTDGVDGEDPKIESAQEEDEDDD